MRAAWALATLLALRGLSYCGEAEAEKGQPPAPHFKRETPTVLAVRKTRDSIASVRVSKTGARKDMIGTGVIVDERGYIVTNHHVIAGADEIKVTLQGDSFPAEIEFDDAGNDLAVLRISPTRRLKALHLGPAADLMVGEEVIAIGHPYGYLNSVSRGIISALGRDISMPDGVNLKDLIQVTATINPGNSGGPLLNINGELIGINVALKQDAQGIAFAINADQVQQLLTRRLSASRKLGVYHGMDCREKVEPEGEGRSRVLVYDVAEKTPAAEAGVKDGDQILRLGELLIVNRFDVERALWGVQRGEEVSMTVLRGGREVTLRMKFGSAAAPASAP
jgi:serine protease Do